jgi:hypothetical protein
MYGMAPFYSCACMQVTGNCICVICVWCMCMSTHAPRRAERRGTHTPALWPGRAAPRRRPRKHESIKASKEAAAESKQANLENVVAYFSRNVVAYFSRFAWAGAAAWTCILLLLPIFRPPSLFPVTCERVLATVGMTGLGGQQRVSICATRVHFQTLTSVRTLAAPRMQARRHIDRKARLVDRKQRLMDRKLPIHL